MHHWHETFGKADTSQGASTHGHPILHTFPPIPTRPMPAKDMVEYALLAGFVAVSAGATLPSVADDLGEIYSKVQSITDKAAGEGAQRDGNKEPTGLPEADYQ